MEQTEKSLRYEVNEYIKTKYNAEPEFLWSKFPNSGLEILMIQLQIF